MERRETISIIAGGWSLKDLGDEGRARIPGMRIGVNDAALRMETAAAVSMDRLWLEGRWQELKALGRPVYARDTALRNIRGRPLWLRPFVCNHETDALTDEPAHFNGRNSGMCAVNVAFSMRPERIILWGFDMCASPTGLNYWYPDYPWSKPAAARRPKLAYAEWARSFDVIARQCAAAGVALLNASPVSKITSLEKVDPWTLLTRTT